MRENKKYEELKWLISIINILVAMYMLEKKQYIDLLMCSLSIYVMIKSVKGKEVIKLGKNAKKEVKSVVWPTKKEIIKTTSVVLIVIVTISIIIWTLDTLISGLIEIIINNKVRECHSVVKIIK